jgi:hypothetical protein
MPLVPDHILLEVEIAIEMLRRCKSPDTNQIPVELIQQEGKHYGLRHINSLIVSGISRIT